MYDPAFDNERPWRPWEMEELASARRAGNGHGKAAAHKGQQRESELRALKEKARSDGHRAGHEAGFAEGREQGYQQGLTEGRDAGRKELEERQQALEEPLQTLATGLQTALARLDVDISDALTDVALAAARRLAGDALDAHPEQVVELIRDLLREEPLFSGHPRLWLHPDDLTLVSAQLSDELDAAGWKVQPDAELDRGGCRVTGPEGELNATRGARWEALLARARRFGSSPMHERPRGHGDGDDS